MERIPKEEKQARNAEQRGVSCTIPDQAMKISTCLKKCFTWSQGDATGTLIENFMNDQAGEN